MVMEVSNQGLSLIIENFNCDVGIACEIGLVEITEKMFEGLYKRGVSLDYFIYKIMVIASSPTL